MNVLIVGAGKGSWTMRGEQLGAAMGARVTSAPTDADWHWADTVVLVKRAGVAWAARARALNVPIVWDALDFWRQPQDNALPEADARALLHRTMETIRPTLTIGATEAMAQAAGGICLPHHSRLDLAPTPVQERERIVIGYDGSAVYLDRWHWTITQACLAFGWMFVVNPPDLRAVDILVSFRGGPWDGWMCREWKSGVKCVNAIVAGRPLISQAGAAVRELQPAGAIVETLAQFPSQVQMWADVVRRRAVVQASETRAAAFGVDAVARRYRDILLGLRARSAVAS